jgi:AraC-like DNA-binding protein
MALLEDQPGASAGLMSEVACLSRDRLSHLFSQEVGISLRKYVQTMKIHAAARFFGSGLSLTEIAVAAGFADSAHFAKVWTQCFGASPARYFSSAALALYPLPRAIRENAGRHPDRGLRDLLPDAAFAYPPALPRPMQGIA